MAFDLDKDELKATRKMRGLDDGVYEDKMSEADKMLHEIEYEFEKENDEFIIYKKDDENCYPYPIELSFNKKAKTVVKYCELYPDRLWLTMQELQAINKKCKEMGWI